MINLTTKELAFATDNCGVKSGRDVDKLKDLISRVDGISINQQDSNLMNIITEEAEAYFKGQKSLDDVTSIIQSRATIYVNENK